MGVPAREWTRDGFVISTDRARLDVDAVHRLLAASYWGEGISRERVVRCMEHSLPFGIYRADTGAQVGYARVTTDFTTFAYVADVIIAETERGHGLGKWLMECMLAHPDLRGLRRWLLATRDAHGLYAQFGFTPLQVPERYMERFDPDVYKRDPS